MRWHERCFVTGVVHRDLKPGNVLFSKGEEDTLPMLKPGAVCRWKAAGLQTNPFHKPCRFPFLFG